MDYQNPHDSIKLPPREAFFLPKFGKLLDQAIETTRLGNVFVGFVDHGHDHDHEYIMPDMMSNTPHCES